MEKPGVKLFMFNGEPQPKNNAKRVYALIDGEKHVYKPQLKRCQTPALMCSTPHLCR